MWKLGTTAEQIGLGASVLTSERCAALGLVARCVLASTMLAAISLCIAGCGRLGFETTASTTTDRSLSDPGRLNAVGDSGSSAQELAGMGNVESIVGDAGADVELNGGGGTGGIGGSTSNGGSSADGGIGSGGMSSGGMSSGGMSSGGSSAGAGSGASCDDAVQNGDEVGVDCGGACPACPTCSDGVKNQNEVGVDCGGPCSACGVNTPPLAAISVSPGAGWFDTLTPTEFQADAAGSSDNEDPLSALSYAWDWENDGSFAPADVGSRPPPHSYSAAGTHTVVLRITDTRGAVSHATFEVVVRARTHLLVVTTAVDENDANATPGPNFSLREAIKYANTTSGRQSILIPPGTTIVLGSSMVAANDVAGVDVVGDGAVLDGNNAVGRCLPISGNANHYFGLEIRGCRQEPISLSGGSGNRVSRAYIHDNGAEVVVGANGGTFGPANEVTRSGGAGVYVTGSDAVIIGVSPA